MFEQTFVRSAGAARKPWPVALSMTGQALAVTAMLMIPLLKTGEIVWKPAMVVYAPARIVPPAVQVRTSASQSNSASSVLRPVFQPRFTAPAHIPDRIATTMGDPPPVIVSTGSAGSFGESFGGNVAPLTALGMEGVRPPETGLAVKMKPAAVRVSVGVQQAMLLHQVKPIYPPLARSARISGTVRLTAVIAIDGTIQKLQVIGGHPLLVNAALEAARQWRYKPTLLSNQPVEVITEIDVNFTFSN